MSQFKRFGLVLLLILLSACGDSGVGELKSWMAQVKKETQVRVVPVAEPKVFKPEVYAGANLIDPFDSGKLMVVFARLRAANDNGLKPDLDRPKEALEGYALETMSMVGSIDNHKKLIGLVQVGKLIFPVTVGSYVGQNFGKVITVSEARIELVETVQDGSGEWAERKASLELQEAKK